MNFGQSEIDRRIECIRRRVCYRCGRWMIECDCSLWALGRETLIIVFVTCVLPLIAIWWVSAC